MLNRFTVLIHQILSPDEAAVTISFYLERARADESSGLD